MIFKVNIGTLTNTVTGYDKALEILSEQNNKVNSSIKELTDLGWSGTARDKFLEAHKIRQNQYILLEKEITYMKDALEKIEKIAAVELKRECENFVNYIERVGQGGALTGADVGVISFYGETTPINRNVDNCINDDYKKISSNMNKIMNIVDSLEYTSFGAGTHISSEVETSIKNQTTSLTDFDNGLNSYYNRVRAMESNICSIFSKISGINDIEGFKSSSVISPSGEVDKNKVKEIVLKNSGNVSDEDKQTLVYLDRVLGDKKYHELINEIVEDKKAEVKKEKESNIKKNILKLVTNSITDRNDPIGQVEDDWKAMKSLYSDTGTDEFVKSKIGDDNYNQIMSCANSVKGLIDNPVGDLNKLNNYLSNTELGKYIDNNKELHDYLKMGVIRSEALTADAINMGKGIVGLHDLARDDLNIGQEYINIETDRALKINGMDNDEAYNNALNEKTQALSDAKDKTWETAKAIVPGIIHDVVNTLDLKKAYDWETNPDMTLEDAQDWSQSAINTAMLVDGIKGGAGFVKGKFFNAGEVGADAGLSLSEEGNIAGNVDGNLANTLESIEKQDININDFNIKDVDADIDAASIEESLDTQTEIANKNIEAKDFTKDNVGEVSKVDENANEINDKNIKSEDTSGNVKNEAVDVDKITKDETETAVIGDVTDTTKTPEVSKGDKEAEKDINGNDNKRGSDPENQGPYSREKWEDFLNNKFGEESVTHKSNIKYKKDYYVEHTTGPIEKFTERNGISGGHNYDEFNKYFDNSPDKYKLKQGSDVKIPHPEIDGIFDIEYRVEYEKMDYTGKRGTGKYNTLPPERRPPYKKTVYDPEKITNEEIIELSKKAVEEGLENGRIEILNNQPKMKIQGQTYYNGKVLKFEAFQDINTGVIENAYPVLEWAD